MCHLIQNAHDIQRPKSCNLHDYINKREMKCLTQTCYSSEIDRWVCRLFCRCQIVATKGDPMQIRPSKKSPVNMTFIHDPAT